ncbi:MAG: sigma-70 family RNA polymerase sigma factor, partial [Planctomycetes bacterium]|nr:sigma-70 family RNA polymerase sigma factor [Planctomycetota bacterium]
MSRRDLDACFARFCRDRDPRALAAVFERAAPALLRRARRMLRDRGAAEDVVQELFVSLLRNGTSYDERRPCLPFLVGSLRRHAVRWQRRRALAPLGDAEFSSADHSDPAGGAARREAFAAIHAAIAGLPASCRQAVADYLET